jgi:hypothetical protein
VAVRVLDIPDGFLARAPQHRLPERLARARRWKRKKNEVCGAIWNAFYSRLIRRFLERQAKKNLSKNFDEIRQ